MKWFGILFAIVATGIAGWMIWDLLGATAFI